VITTAASVSGKFAGAFRPGLQAGMDWGIHYAANLVYLAIGIPGDHNNNGTIDAAD